MSNLEEEEEVLFDEFGNPLGVSGDEYSESDTEGKSDEEYNLQSNMEPNDSSDDGETNAIEVAVPEEKRPLESILKKFDSDVEISFATEDARTINEPTIDPVITKVFRLEENAIPETVYSKDYLWKLTDIPSRVRNVAVCGNIHAGKTSLIDLLITQTHLLENVSIAYNDERPLKYTDNHILEQQRGISIKSNVMTLLLSDYKNNSTVINFIDTPGHISFIDELSSALNLADVVMLCVDSVESVTSSTELIVEQALKSNTKIILVITKIDRLIMELKLPPVDAYYKLRNIIDDVNFTINKISKTFNSEIDTSIWRLSPDLNNVCFSSSLFNTIFNLESFAQIYFERYNIKITEHLNLKTFSKRLWGDVYFIDKKFTVNPNNKSELASSRTFIAFILHPIYKIATRCLTLDPPELKKFLETQLNLNFTLNRLKSNSRPLLKDIFFEFFGPPSHALVASLKGHSFMPRENNLNKFNYLFTHPSKDDTITECISKCDSTGPLVAYINRLVDTSDSTHFYAQIRVLSGTLQQQHVYKLLGEDYFDDANNITTQVIRHCYLQCGRYRYEVPSLKAGSVGLISGPGLDSFIVKSGTLYDESIKINSSTPVFRSNEQIASPAIKVGIQPRNPKDGDDFKLGLEKLVRAYHGCKLEIDDFGRYFIYGFSEIYLDCALHDLRKLYGHLEINVSDPTVSFGETIVVPSTIPLLTKSNNQLNSITIISEPLESSLADDLTSGKLDITRETPVNFAKLLRNFYGWDSLASRSIWHIGADRYGSAILCDDTLPDEVNKDLLAEVKEFIIQGFKWAVSEGPLCNENVRNVKFKIIGATFATEKIDRNKTQIIQMTKKACYATILTSQPRMLEPTFDMEIVAFGDVLELLEKLVKRRRSFIHHKTAIAGTPLFKVFGTVPVIDSYGLETDMRLLTRGRAFPQMKTGKWKIVPGDPLDETAFISPLKPAPYKSLARDFMLKSRKRKNMSKEITIQDFVDSETWSSLREMEVFQ